VALCDGKLFTVTGPAGSSKLDQLESLDLFALAGSYAFGERMRSEVAGLLQGLEVWAEKQATGMELAAQPEGLAANFESLLRVSQAGLRMCSCCWGVGMQGPQGWDRPPHISCPVHSARQQLISRCETTIRRSWA
jgi:hypothetical protein